MDIFNEAFKEYLEATRRRKNFSFMGFENYWRRPLSLLDDTTMLKIFPTVINVQHQMELKIVCFWNILPHMQPFKFG